MKTSFTSFVIVLGACLFGSSNARILRGQDVLDVEAEEALFWERQLGSSTAKAPKAPKSPKAKAPKAKAPKSPKSP